MAGLGYSGQGRRSDGSGRIVGAPVTAGSARKARSNTGCAAAVAVAVAAVVAAAVVAVAVVVAAAAAAAAAVVVLRKVSMLVGKQVSMQDDAGQVLTGHAGEGATATQGHEQQARPAGRQDVIAGCVLTYLVLAEAGPGAWQLQAASWRHSAYC